ncbi:MULTISPECIES: hypothetical protein [Bifidobacterium]|uniref:hypothetical protein n=1 Tax=Bifidobacterium TaxID=1678 RepID=UPI0015E3C6AA|nr:MULTISPECIES: hypothetical protein [Bifidobacterium]
MAVATEGGQSVVHMEDVEYVAWNVGRNRRIDLMLTPEDLGELASVLGGES